MGRVGSVEQKCLGDREGWKVCRIVYFERFVFMSSKAHMNLLIFSGGNILLLVSAVSQDPWPTQSLIFGAWSGNRTVQLLL